jgi:hypothetical protein
LQTYTILNVTFLTPVALTIERVLLPQQLTPLGGALLLKMRSIAIKDFTAGTDWTRCIDFQPVSVHPIANVGLTRVIQHANVGKNAGESSHDAQENMQTASGHLVGGVVTIFDRWQRCTNAGDGVAIANLGGMKVTRLAFREKVLKLPAVQCFAESAHLRTPPGPRYCPTAFSAIGERNL